MLPSTFKSRKEFNEWKEKIIKLQNPIMAEQELHDTMPSHYVLCSTGKIYERDPHQSLEKFIEEVTENIKKYELVRTNSVVCLLYDNDEIIGHFIASKNVYGNRFCYFYEEPKEGQHS